MQLQLKLLSLKKDNFDIVQQWCLKVCFYM